MCLHIVNRMPFKTQPWQWGYSCLPKVPSHHNTSCPRSVKRFVRVVFIRVHCSKMLCKRKTNPYWTSSGSTFLFLSFFFCFWCLMNTAHVWLVSNLLMQRSHKSPMCLGDNDRTIPVVLFCLWSTTGPEGEMWNDVGGLGGLGDPPPALKYTMPPEGWSATFTFTDNCFLTV